MQPLISSAERQRGPAPRHGGQEEAGRDGGELRLESREQKEKLVAAGVSWEEDEDADERNGAGTISNKEKMSLVGREHKGTAWSAHWSRGSERKRRNNGWSVGSQEDCTPDWKK